MKKLVNSETDRSVTAFLDAVPNAVRQADAKQICAILQEMTGLEPRIWGKSIVGFGKYTYQRKNGDEFEWFHVGFSPAKAHLSLYVMYDINEEAELLARLGPHKTGKGCLYIKRLEQVNMDVLKQLLAKSNRWS